MSASPTSKTVCYREVSTIGSAFEGQEGPRDVLISVHTDWV